MNPLPISLPRGARIVFNSLYDSREPILLGQDVLLISLPNDTFIDVGWYPEHDQAGTYRICVYRTDWQNQLLSEPVRTTDARKVAVEVGRLALQYSAEAIARGVSWSQSSFVSGVINTSCSTVWISPRFAKELQYG